ncbi:MAG: sigma-54 dependent transcriptional regulator [Pseudomonadota bacterium]
MSAILLIDDDAVLANVIQQHLQTIDHQVFTARSWNEARGILESNEIQLVVTDVQLPDANGMELLAQLVKLYPVIVFTAYGSIKDAVGAMKGGAAEYLTKPINLDELELVVSRVLESSAQRRDLQFCRRHLRRRTASLMIGESTALHKLNDLIDAVAPSEMTVLIQGESGVGKELVAQAIHDRSLRAERNFVAVDCCTLPEKIFESELFGHEKGAFTGAVSLKKGLIEGADGGTLFLDEIGEIETAVQAKLLRILETGFYRRVGGTRDIQANVRIVAATNRDLAEMVEEGSFRRDLFFRLNAFLLDVPPLRERRSDVPKLVEHFIRNHDFSSRIQKSVSRQAMDDLCLYEWPGNIRELKNVVERAIILSRTATEILPEHLSFLGATAANPSPANISLDFDKEPTLEEIEGRYLSVMMQRHEGHRARVAKALGVSERNVYRMLARHGLKD